MRLYKVKTRFLGKDLHQDAVLEYVVAENDDSIYDYVGREYKYNEYEWPESVGMTREAIIATKGDYASEYRGEFYDQKYGWEDLGEVSADDIANLKRLKII